MKTLKSIITLSILSIIGLLSSCNNNSLSEIGESIQPTADKVAGTEYQLQFESQTIPSQNIYSTNTLGLLGNIYDDNFGEFKGEFIAQVRTAPGLTFPSNIVNNKIDSTIIRVNFIQSIGSKDLPIKIAVYELDNSVTRQAFSEKNLDKYKVKSKLIGSSNIIYSKDVHTASINGYQLNYFDIKVDNKIGEKIYNLSKQKPEYFNTQEIFNKNVFSGILVTPSTGKGFMVQTVGISLRTYYTIMEKDSNGKDVAVAHSQSFINTNQTAQINGLSNTLNNSLLSDNKYTYISSPAGVSTRLILRKEELNKLLASQGKVNLGHDWIITSAEELLKVVAPNKPILNPPSNVLLVRSDSVKSFFENKLPSSGFNAVGFVSTKYSVSSYTYEFPNISGIITNFIKEESTFDSSSNSWIVKKDLTLDVIPVNLIGYTDNNSGRQYTALEEYMFPSIVRLSKSPKDLQIRVITSKFN